MESIRITFTNHEEHGVGYGFSVRSVLLPLRALRGIWDYVIESYGPYGWSKISQGTLIS
jgi:hypothetical protein